MFLLYNIAITYYNYYLYLFSLAGLLSWRIDLFARFWSDADKKISDAITWTNRRSWKRKGLGRSFEVVLSQCLGFLRTKELCSLFYNNDPWSDHRIRKRSIVSLDILITLSLYELARLLSGPEFCSRDHIHFQTQPTYMVDKDSFSGGPFKQKNWKCVWNRVSKCQNPSMRMHLFSWNSRSWG